MTPTHEPWDMHAAQTPLSSSMEEDARLSLYWCGLPWASPHSTPHALWMDSASAPEGTDFACGTPSPGDAAEGRPGLAARGTGAGKLCQAGCGHLAKHILLPRRHNFKGHQGQIWGL